MSHVTFHEVPAGDARAGGADDLGSREGVPLSLEGGLRHRRAARHPPRDASHLDAPQAETDAGNRPGLTTDERKRLRELERENRELKRANEILKAASIFFATELDGRPKKS
jgi:transposase-like protein